MILNDIENLIVETKEKFIHRLAKVVAENPAAAAATATLPFMVYGIRSDLDHQRNTALRGVGAIASLGAGLGSGATYLAMRSKKKD